MKRHARRIGRCPGQDRDEVAGGQCGPDKPSRREDDAATLASGIDQRLAAVGGKPARGADVDPAAPDPEAPEVVSGRGPVDQAIVGLEVFRPLGRACLREIGPAGAEIARGRRDPAGLERRILHAAHADRQIETLAHQVGNPGAEIQHQAHLGPFGLEIAERGREVMLHAFRHGHPHRAGGTVPALPGERPCLFEVEQDVMRPFAEQPAGPGQAQLARCTMKQGSATETPDCRPASENEPVSTVFAKSVIAASLSNVEAH